MLRCHQGMLLTSHAPPKLNRLTSFQGKVYDVTGNKMYAPGQSYNGKSKSHFPVATPLETTDGPVHSWPSRPFRVFTCAPRDQLLRLCHSLPSGSRRSNGLQRNINFQSSHSANISNQSSPAMTPPAPWA